MRLPPRDVSPHQLFRLLAGASRPRLPIRLAWLDDAPGLSACVVALAGHELDAIIPGDKPLDEIDSAHARAHLVAACLHDEHGPLITAEQLEDLVASDVSRLFLEVVEALGKVSPIYGRSSLAHWESTLAEGSRHPSNFALRQSVLMSRATLPFATKDPFVRAPEKHFGAALASLTDGQWMAYDAAWGTR